MSDRKIALITGANKGLGFETARQLAQQGITVLLGARDAGRGETSARKLRDEGLDVRAVKLDVDDRADHAAVAESIEKDFGVLDILINNAGVQDDGALFGNSTLTVSEEAIRKTFDTNFYAVIALTRTLLPLLEKSAAGRIVNLSSILGSLSLHATKGQMGMKLFAYDTSKTALNSFTIHLAAALDATKIKVNSAHPGWVKTDMGTDAAPMDVVEGSKTGVWLATLAEDGPTGGFFHMRDEIAW